MKLDFRIRLERKSFFLIVCMDFFRSDMLSKKGVAMKKRKNRYGIDYDGMQRTSSMQECTGMIPTPPKSKEEYESYLSLYGVEFPSEVTQD